MYKWLKQRELFLLWSFYQFSFIACWTIAIPIQEWWLPTTMLYWPFGIRHVLQSSFGHRRCVYFELPSDASSCYVVDDETCSAAVRTDQQGSCWCGRRRADSKSKYKLLQAVFTTQIFVLLYQSDLEQTLAEMHFACFREPLLDSPRT